MQQCDPEHAALHTRAADARRTGGAVVALAPDVAAIVGRGAADADLTTTNVWYQRGREKLNERPGRTDWMIDAAKTTVEGNLRRQACIYHWKVEA